MASALTASPGGGVQRAATRAASGRNASELRCQHADCASPLDVTAIPVEYEAILRQLFRNAVAEEEGAEGAMSPGSGSSARRGSPRVFASHSASSSESSLSGSSGGGGGGGANSNHDASALPWDALHDAARRGDNVSFAVIVSALAAPATGLDLPLCDSCTEAALRAQSRVFYDASDERDSVLHFADALAARIPPLMAAQQQQQQGGGEDGRSSGGSGVDYDVLAVLTEEEERLRFVVASQRAQLRSLRAARRLLRTSIAPLVRCAEAEGWQLHLGVSSELAGNRARMASLRDRDARWRDYLDRLRCVSVHSDAFFIWHRGPFVTINGCRLGRLGQLGQQVCENKRAG